MEGQYKGTQGAAEAPPTEPWGKWGGEGTLQFGILSFCLLPGTWMATGWGQHPPVQSDGVHRTTGPSAPTPRLLGLPNQPRYGGPPKEPGVQKVSDSQQDCGALAASMTGRLGAGSQGPVLLAFPWGQRSQP